jgi:hypothetical protein
MEEMNNTDTPQPQTANTTGMDPFGSPIVEGSDNTNLSVADAFSEATESTNQEAPSNDGKPIESQETNVDNQPYDAKNDEKRFEYWQSQAAKKENELKTFKGEVEQAITQSQQQPIPNNAPKAPAEFPPPPAQPEKPHSFSREAAWSDSSSESAKYLDDMDTWNSSINEYRDLRSQYEIALVRERLEDQEKQKTAMMQESRARNAQKAQVKEVYDNLRGHYGFEDGDAQEFIKTMANPNSISMENLVQLYRMQKGAGQVNTESQGPSEAFQQTRNAQQVPSPMGVMPSQTSETNRSDENMIMDELINTHKSKNPWT